MISPLILLGLISSQAQLGQGTPVHCAGKYITATGLSENRVNHVPWCHSILSHCTSHFYLKKNTLQGPEVPFYYDCHLIIQE